ncbi:MAG: hypothetical protein ACM3XO_07970 [Bacteroidota bacterium]
MPCPRNNKSKTGDGDRPAEPQTRISKNETDPGPESLPGPQAEEDAWLVDEETVMYFLYRYQDLEQALMRAGYIQAGGSPAGARPDWPRFARQIQTRFEQDPEPVLQAAVTHMLWDDDNLAQRNERLENSALWENRDLNNDVVWLAELLQQTWQKLVHGLNFPGQPGCDIDMVSAALFIVDAWSRLDADVEKQLSVSGL